MAHELSFRIASWFFSPRGNSVSNLADRLGAVNRVAGIDGGYKDAQSARLGGGFFHLRFDDTCKLEACGCGCVVRLVSRGARQIDGPGLAFPMGVSCERQN